MCRRLGGGGDDDSQSESLARRVSARARLLPVRRWVDVCGSGGPVRRARPVPRCQRRDAALPRQVPVRLRRRRRRCLSAHAARRPLSPVRRRPASGPARQPHLHRSVGRAGGRLVGDVAAFSAHHAVTGLILYSKLHSVMANAAEYDTDR